MIYPNKKLGSTKIFEEVMAIWLKDEWSNRFCGKYPNREDEKIASNPKLLGEVENERRKQILMAERSNVVGELPPDTKWYSIDFTREDIDRTFLIPILDWTSDMSNDSYSLKEAATRIGNGSFENPKYKKHYKKVKDITLHLDEGNISDKIILVASSPTSPFTVIEGNHRMIAISLRAIKGGKDPVIKEVFLGISPSMKGYNFHIEKWRPEA